MPKFTYLGITEEQKKVGLEKQMKNLSPPEKRGKEPMYHIIKDDDEEVRERKKAATAKWTAMRKKEIIEGIEAADKSLVFNDPTDALGKRKIVFEKGKAVQLSETHPMFTKLKLMSVGVDQPKLHAQHVIVVHECFKMEPDGPAPKAEK